MHENSIRSTSTRPYPDVGIDIFRDRNEVAREQGHFELPHISDETMELLKLELEELETTYATRLSKEGRRIFGQFLYEKRTSRARNELADMMGGVATLLSDECDKLGATDEQRRELIDLSMSEIADSVIQKMADAKMQQYDQSSPLRKKIYDTWNLWSKEGFKGKVKKGLVFAVPGAALGLIAAPLAAGAFGAGMAAVAVTGARSVGRTVGRGYIDTRANAHSIAEAQRNDIGSALASFTEEREKNRGRWWVRSKNKGASTDELLGVIDGKVDTYRSRNQSRLLGGAAIAVSAGLVSPHLGDWLSDSLFGTPAYAEDSLAPRHNLSGRGNNDGSEYRQDMGKPLNTSDEHVRGESDAFRQDMGIPVDASDAHAASGDSFRQDMGEATLPGASAGEHVNGIRDTMFRGSFGTRHLSLEGRSTVLADLQGYRVRSGDSIWRISERLLEQQGVEHPTVYEIDATKDLVLQELRKSGATDASGLLTVGQTFRFTL